MSYGYNCDALFAADPNPALSLLGLNDQHRYLFGQQLNLLAVHCERLEEVRSAGLERGMLKPRTIRDVIESTV